MVTKVSLLLIAVAVVPLASSSVIIECRGTLNNKTYTMFNLFSTPYANLGKDGITGHLEGQLYFSNTTCDSPVPPSPWLSDNTTNSLLLIPGYSSHCTLERILLARSVGYEGILTYTNNNDNLTITKDIISTQIPIAIIDNSYVEELMNTIIIPPLNNTDNSTVPLSSTVTVYGSIEVGIIVVSFSFVFFISCTCCVVICTVICCKLCRDYHGNGDDLRYLLEDDRHPYGRNRQELIESILRHLQEMERDVGAQTPLGPDNIKKFPKREYGTKDELHDTCTICVEDFKEGVTVRQLPCQHIFHPECIDEWLSRHSSLCPLCKLNLRDARSTPRLVEGRGRRTGSNISTDSEMVSQHSDYGSVMTRSI